MKINTAGDVLMSIARGLALVLSLPARSRALVDFREEKKNYIGVQAWEVPVNSRGVLGVLRSVPCSAL